MRKGEHESLAGRTIAGKFVIEGLIGSGAMGAVFRARQVALEKTVAIKVMHGEHADDPAFGARFHREAKAASRLNHPNSIQVLDFGSEPDGLLYIAMEYLDGRSLHQVMREEWPLVPERVADILMQTLAALAVAHDMGVVHRDLKPENVMVLRGTDDDGHPKDVVKVCDFGIAKITNPRAYRGQGERESDAPVTTAGFLVGTPEYMSPEQGRGEKLDSRSDLYSVGVILYEMLTRRVPFDAENAIGVVLKHITEEPKPPSQVVQGCDPRLEAVAMRALKKFREERHASAREMRAELRAVMESPPPPSEVVPTAESAAALVNAATVAMPIVVRASGTDPVAPKPTLQGTTAAVAGPPRRRRGLVLAGVTVVALGMGASGAALWVKAQPHAGAAGPATPVVTAPGTAPKPMQVAPSTPAFVPPGAAAPVPSPRSSPAPRPMAAPALGLHGKPGPVAPVASGKTAAVSSGILVASAAPVMPAASAAPAASTSDAVAAALPSATPSAAAPDPASNPSPAATDDAGAGGADFDPERAYVEIGMINTEGTNEKAVRGALHTAGLSQCYKTSLRARGSRSTGVATLNLSFDAGGSARSAVLTGADFLPGLARCVQDTAAGVHVGKEHVDPGGGVAEVTLAFREP